MQRKQNTFGLEAFCVAEASARVSVATTVTTTTKKTTTV
jgi:hypothetical protein